MVQFGKVVLAYFIIGAMMWSGGVIRYENSGVGQLIVEPNDRGGVGPNSETGEELQSMSGPIQQAAQSVGGGGLLAIWNLIVKIIGFLFWPLTALGTVGAPTEIVTVAGGAFVVALLVGILRIIRGGA